MVQTRPPQLDLNLLFASFWAHLAPFRVHFRLPWPHLAPLSSLFAPFSTNLARCCSFLLQHAPSCRHLGTILPPLTLNLPQKGPTEEPNASKASPQTLKFIETHQEKLGFRENHNFRPRAQKIAPKARSMTPKAPKMSPNDPPRPPKRPPKPPK